MIDNYDSFTYNLVQYLGEISGTEIQVFRNDEITVEGIREDDPTHVVVSPGPCTPDEAGDQPGGHRRFLAGSARYWGSAWVTSRSARCTAAR